MKILVLGGCGIQGRTAVHDLAGARDVDEIIVADADPKGLDLIKDFTDMSTIRFEKIDATAPDSFDTVFSQADGVIDLLPRMFLEDACMAAIRHKKPMVNTNYAYPVTPMDEQAKAADVSIMPECGLDPGIDLFIYGEAARRFDELNVINSYCGGFPEKAACDNPLNYKISWNWEGVMSSTMRDGRIIKKGVEIDIPGISQHDETYVHNVDFPGLGELEAIPNGDAVFFTKALNVRNTIVESGRYSLRWPGWSAFWRPMKQLGFLSREPVNGLPCEVSPYQLMDKLIGPQLAYKEGEKDLVAMINIFEGVQKGIKMRMTSRVLIERDLDTGLMAMSMGVGYPASIVVKMLVRGDISEKGVLSPLYHIPGKPFREELGKRGVIIQDEMEPIA